MIKLIAILNTPPSSRSSNSLKQLVNITQDIPFFIKIRTEINECAHRCCSQYMRYLYKSKNEYVFNAGDEGDLFYIILHGSVKVLVPTYVNSDETEMTEVATLDAGKSFGELALLRNQRRVATIICETNTHLATLEKADYLRILGENSSLKLDELVGFLASLPVFNRWPRKDLIKLSYYFTPLLYVRNQIIYRENEPAKDVYIILKGEVEIFSKVAVGSPRNIRLNQFGRPMARIKSVNRYEQARLGIKTKGEIVGHEEVIKNTNRVTGCKCYSDKVELLSISKLEFKRRIRNEEALSQFMVINKIKEVNRQKIVKEVQTHPNAFLDKKHNKQLSEEETSISNSPPFSPPFSPSTSPSFICKTKTFMSSKSITSTFNFDLDEGNSYLRSPTIMTAHRHQKTLSSSTL